MFGVIVMCVGRVGHLEQQQQQPHKLLKQWVWKVAEHKVHVFVLVFAALNARRKWQMTNDNA